MIRKGNILKNEFLLKIQKVPSNRYWKLSDEIKADQCGNDLIEY